MTRQSVKIIELPPSRWKEYKQLRLEALKKEPHAFGASYNEERQRKDKDWRERLVASKKGKQTKFLFAEHNSELIGLLNIAFEQSEKLKHGAMLYQVYVKSEWRGKGVANMLMTAVFALARKRRLVKLCLWVSESQKAAIRFYQKSGFVITGTAKYDSKVNGKYYDEIYMEKYLRTIR